MSKKLVKFISLHSKIETDQTLLVIFKEILCKILQISYSETTLSIILERSTWLVNLKLSKDQKMKFLLYVPSDNKSHLKFLSIRDSWQYSMSKKIKSVNSSLSIQITNAKTSLLFLLAIQTGQLRAFMMMGHFISQFFINLKNKLLICNAKS